MNATEAPTADEVQQQVNAPPSTQNCAKCQVPVYWATNVAGAKPAQIDAARSVNGTYVIFYKPDFGRKKFTQRLEGAALDTAREKGTPLHTNHYDTCSMKGNRR